MRIPRWFPILMAALMLSGSLSAAVRTKTVGGGTRVQMGEVKQDSDQEKQRQQEAYRKKLQAADELMTQKQWFQARKALDSARRMAPDASVVEELNKRYLDLENEGRRQLEAAKEAFKKGDYVVAMDAFKIIQRDFALLPVAQSASRLEKAAEQDPHAIAALQQRDAQDLRNQLEVTLGLHASAAQSQAATATAPADWTACVYTLPEEKQARAVDLLGRLSSQYPASASGKQAADTLKTLESDKAFSRKLEQYRQAQQAQSLLQKAQSYEKANLAEQARKAYQEIVDRFPDSPQASQARAALAVPARP